MNLKDEQLYYLINKINKDIETFEREINNGFFPENYKLLINRSRLTKKKLINVLKHNNLHQN